MDTEKICIGIAIVLVFILVGSYFCSKPRRMTRLEQPMLNVMHNRPQPNIQAMINSIPADTQYEIRDALDESLRDVSIGVGPGLYGPGREFITR